MKEKIKMYRPKETETECGVTRVKRVSVADDVDDGWAFLDEYLPMVKDWKRQARERGVYRDPGYVTTLCKMAVLETAMELIESRLLEGNPITDAEFKRLREYNKMYVDYIKQGQSLSRSNQISLKEKYTQPELAEKLCKITENQFDPEDEPDQAAAGVQAVAGVRTNL